MKLILLGPPGSGKGTQGELLAKKFNLPRLSMGALIRRHYREKTALGVKAGEYMVKGMGIPAEIHIAMLAEWINEHPTGFIIDNIVRTKEQLDEFKKFREEKKLHLDKVIYLKVSENEAIKRLVKRAQEKLRPDESIDALHQRFRVFYQDMDVIFNYFKNLNVFVEVNGEQSEEKVNEEILLSMSSLRKQGSSS